MPWGRFLRGQGSGTVDFFEVSDSSGLGIAFRGLELRQKAKSADWCGGRLGCLFLHFLPACWKVYADRADHLHTILKPHNLGALQSVGNCSPLFADPRDLHSVRHLGYVGWGGPSHYLHLALSPKPHPMSSYRIFGIVLACLAATSCVSQEKYDEAVTTAQMYQRSAHDNAEYIAQLQGENASLKMAMDKSGGMHEGVIDAAYTADIDERLASLQKLLAGSGYSKDEVTLLDIEGGYGFSMSASVLFPSGSAQVSSDGQELLVQMAKSIGTGSYERLWIRGHSDSDKVTKPATLKLYPHGNLQLSADRALEVATVLFAKGGLDKLKMAIAGLGSSLPVASNESPEGKSANRRVEIFVIENPTEGE